MAIDLLALIKVCPFSEQKQRELLVNFAKYSPEQKAALTDLCWNALIQLYFIKLKEKKDLWRLEIMSGKRKYNFEEIKKLEAELTREFVQKIKSASAESSLQEIRAELKKELEQRRKNKS